MANEDELLRMTLTVVDRATGELAKIEKSLKGVGESATHRFRQPAVKNVSTGSERILSCKVAGEHY
jgi:hypothetical protein